MSERSESNGGDEGPFTPVLRVLRKPSTNIAYLVWFGSLESKQAKIPNDPSFSCPVPTSGNAKPSVLIS